MSDYMITKEYIDNELRQIHNKMTKLFQVNFSYFKEIIILPQSKTKNILTEKMRLNLERKGVKYDESLWKQITENFFEDGTRGFFENIAFYNDRNETMYITQNLLINHPETVIPVCVHELAEKLIFTITPPSYIATSAEKLIEKHIKSQDPNEKMTLEELMSRFKEIVFKSVFKEGCCEAIALRTLSYSGHKEKVLTIEKELLQGHSKWISILFDIECVTDNVENHNFSEFLKIDKISELEDKREQINRILKLCQIVKIISYNLGYPIANEIINKHGLEGIKTALENPPLKAEYFDEPSKYLSYLES